MKDYRSPGQRQPIQPCIPRFNVATPPQEGGDGHGNPDAFAMEAFQALARGRPGRGGMAQLAEDAAWATLTAEHERQPVGDDGAKEEYEPFIHHLFAPEGAVGVG